ncbi:MAG: RidA family protein [Thermodesulfovibrionales bacterium]
MSHAERLKELHIKLPDAPSPLGSYVPCVRTGNLIFVSGMLPLKDGKLLYAGRVGVEVSQEDAQKASRQAVINGLAVIRSFSGSLDNIVQCVKLNGYVASAEGFYDQPSVINAASELLFEIFGDKGKHSRAAVGVYTLPMNSPVEIDFIFELES